VCTKIADSESEIGEDSGLTGLKGELEVLIQATIKFAEVEIQEGLLSDEVD